MMNSEAMINRGFEMTEKTMASFYDTWSLILGSLTWSQEQMDKLVQKYMEQKKVAREDAVKFVAELADQAKKYQQQFGDAVKETVVSTSQNTTIPNLYCTGDLSRRIDELSKKVDNLSNQG